MSFYIVNLLDLNPNPKDIAVQQANNDNILSNNPQLAKAFGSSNASLAGFVTWLKVNNLSANADVYNADPDADGLQNYLEYIHGTDPNNKDTDGDGFTDKQEIINGYDPDAKGDVMTVVNVKISKLGVEAPMIWSKTDIEANMLKDLENGISHFMKTASPGQNGNMIVSGHSSNYIWAKGDYNHIFKDLNNLENGDVISVQTLQRNGRVITYQYKVSDKFVALPDEEKIFADTQSPTLTLSTCWPIGTKLKRIIVKANLI